MESAAHEVWLSSSVPSDVHGYLWPKSLGIGMNSHGAILSALSHPSGPYAGQLDDVRLNECLDALELDERGDG